MMHKRNKGRSAGLISSILIVVATPLLAAALLAVGLLLWGFGLDSRDYDKQLRKQ